MKDEMEEEVEQSGSRPRQNQPVLNAFSKEIEVQ
jgi:hypothetical protein